MAERGTRWIAVLLMVAAALVAWSGTARADSLALAAESSATILPVGDGLLVAVWHGPVAD